MEGELDEGEEEKKKPMSEDGMPQSFQVGRGKAATNDYASCLEN